MAKLMPKLFAPNSPSDLEADDEDNQDYDSLTMSDSTLSLMQPSGAVLDRASLAPPPGPAAGNPPSSAPLTATRPTNGRPATPIADSIGEVSLSGSSFSCLVRAKKDTRECRAFSLLCSNWRELWKRTDDCSL